MFRVLANHPHHAFAADDFALIANFLYRCAYLHISSQLPVLSCQSKPLWRGALATEILRASRSGWRRRTPAALTPARSFAMLRMRARGSDASQAPSLIS